MAAQLAPGYVETEQVGDTLVVRLTRPDLVDEPIIGRVGQDLARLLRESEQRHAVVDLGEVQRMSSAMIAQLMAMARKARAMGGRVVVCRVRPEVAEVFTILRLADILPTYASEADALLSF